MGLGDATGGDSHVNRTPRRNAELRGFARCAVGAIAIALSSCTSGRIGLDPVDPSVAYRQNTATALNSSTLSNATSITLRRLALQETYDKDDQRASCIAQMHAMVANGTGGRDELFALAELSYMHGRALDGKKRSRPRPTAAGKLKQRSLSRDQSAAALADEARPHFLAAAVYAYAFLFPEIRDQHVAPLDGRFRVAADLYASGLAHAFADTEPGAMVIAGGVHTLPFGSISIAFDPNELQWGLRTLTDFRWSGSFSLAGLRNHYLKPGIGVPVAARTRLPDGETDFVASTAWVAATVLVRIPEPRRQLRGNELSGTLEVQTADEDHSIDIASRQVPLRSDSSAALAATLEESRFWESELARFLGRALLTRGDSALSAQEPYVGNKIPAVFVHGTDSSPATWANMINDLQYDETIRDRYHFWFFRYDSGSPIMYSSMLLRRALSKAVSELSVDHPENCLNDMIVLGHSQGGLLTKLTAVETGNALWDAYYRTPFDEVHLRPKARALFEEMAFLEPLPYVDRLVFIATPHRGSYLASSRIVQRLASRLIRLPGDVLEISTDITGLGKYSRPGLVANRMPTSIDNMSPGNPFIQAVSELDVAADVPYHSIIPLYPGDSREDGGDGVVKFASAHIDNAASELVIPGGHTTLSDPRTIEEVRRILTLHAAAAQCPPPGSDGQ